MKSIVFAIAAVFCFSSQSFSADAKSPQATVEEFSVQILLSGNQLQFSNKKFKGVADIQEEVCEGLFKYKYTTGHEAKTFQEAAAIRLKMIDAGFTDAFVVRYRDGKRVVSSNLAKVNRMKHDAVPMAVKPVPTESKTTMAPADSKTKPGVGSAVVQTKPEFQGGEEKLELFIKNNLHYPNPPIDKNERSQVFVSFTVDNTGKIKNTKVVGGLNDELDMEALRMVNTMPAWKPGTIGGMTTNMDCFLPVDFREPAEKQMAQSEEKR